MHTSISLKCPVSAHWRCLASTQQMEILKAAQERDWEEAKRVKRDGGGPSDGAQPFVPKPRKRDGLDAYQTTEFICSACMKGGVCMNCLDVVLEPEAQPQLKSDQNKTPDDPDTSRPGWSLLSKPAVQKLTPFYRLECTATIERGHQRALVPLSDLQTPVSLRSPPCA